jgi:valyl-tRNA synthetase
MLTGQPHSTEYSEDFLKKFEQVKECIVKIRSVRQSKGISPKDPLSLLFKGNLAHELVCVISKMANISSVDVMETKNGSMAGVSFMVDTTEFFLPLEDHVDKVEELRKVEEELKYYECFLTNVRKKLSNEKFVSSAPKAVVDLEFKKQQEAEIKLVKLNELKKELTKQ